MKNVARLEFHSLNARAFVCANLLTRELENGCTASLRNGSDLDSGRGSGVRITESLPDSSSRSSKWSQNIAPMCISFVYTREESGVVNNSSYRRQ